MIRGILSAIEIAILSALILATRCANYQDVFFAGNIYFTEADCYARMMRDLALSLRSAEIRPFLAPWWLSPSIAYWSGQPGIAGSSHESLVGIVDSARFFLSDDWQKARQILENHQTTWVIAYDSERVAQNSEAVLNQAVPAYSLCRVLDRMPSHAPFLIFSAQNGPFKLYRTIAR